MSRLNAVFLTELSEFLFSLVVHYKKFIICVFVFVCSDVTEFLGVVFPLTLFGSFVVHVAA